MAAKVSSIPSGHKLTKRQVEEANYQILKTIEPFQTTHSIRADEVMRGDFVVINGHPCRIDSNTCSTTGERQIIGHVIIHSRGELPPHYNYAEFKTTINATEEIPVPKVSFLFIGHIRRNDYIAIDDHPCRVIDTSYSHAGYGFYIHLIAMDIFTGKKTETFVDSVLLVSRLEVKWENKQLLSISDDFFCSLIGESNVVENNIPVHNEALGKVIKDFWSQKERNLIVRTAKTMGIEGIVSVWEVIDVKLLGFKMDGILGFENVETGSAFEVPLPAGENGQEIEKLAEDVERGRSTTIEIYVPIHIESQIGGLMPIIQEFTIEEIVRENDGGLLSGLILVAR